NLPATFSKDSTPCHGNLCDNPLPLPMTRFPKPFRQAVFAVWDGLANPFENNLHFSDIFRGVGDSRGEVGMPSISLANY
ncbi:hypothetical protein AVEN_195851-1, partial [Araneus ventricosus]